jgi:hypothetical protein
MQRLYTVTLTPIKHNDQSGLLEGVAMTGRCRDAPDKYWILTTWELARVFAYFFSVRAIAAIKQRLHSGESVSLPNSYSAMDLTEMGYRLGTEI